MFSDTVGLFRNRWPDKIGISGRFASEQAALNSAVDEVRKEQWRQASKEEKVTLKGLRWLLYMHSSRRTTEQIKRLKALYMNGNRRIHRAWVLSDEFEQFWEFDNQVNAKKGMKIISCHLWIHD